MVNRATRKQENPLRERHVAIRVTPREREAIRVVAEARGMAEGKRGQGHMTLLRTMGLDEIVAEYERLRRVITGEAA